MTDMAELNSALTGRYQIEGELGAGGMATVFRARDQRHDRPVAIKVLRPELAAAIGAERFLREIGIAAQLQHPHILTLIDSGQAGGLLYYVMPLIEGESLRSRLAREGRLPPKEAARLLRDVADGLAYAHRQGVVHRDVKPDNVMLTGGHAMLVDFGVAKALGGAGVAGRDTLTGLGTSLGTPAYMAPEQAAGDPSADSRQDIYSLGVLAYEMLTGAPPFTGSPQQVVAAHITTPPRPVSEACPDVPEGLAAIVMKCLEKDPAGRPQDAGTLVQDFDDVRAAGTLAPAARRLRIPVLAGLALISLLAGTTFVLVLGASAREREARAALPELQRLAAVLEFDSAFTLARSMLPALAGDPVFEEIWNRVSVASTIETEPPGAMVLRSSFRDTTAWERVGVTPIDSVRLPRLTVTRLRVEKDGYRTLNRLVTAARTVSMVLDSTNSPDSDMVRVEGGAISPGLVGIDHLPAILLEDFSISRHEVTNAEFQAFVRAGGYSDPAFWQEPFERGGKVLSFSKAVAAFTDRTGRPGPSTWEGGDFPPGFGEYPVAGISWYEAEAYARFAGRSLPTVYHWSRAAVPSAAPWVIPGSRMETTAPAPGSQAAGMGPFGTFDMAGNVREWAYNSDSKGQRYILGGGWSDFTYAFNDAYAQDPFDRSPVNGLRLAKYAAGDSAVRLAAAPVERAYRDYRRERPVSDDVFRAMLQNYDYDRGPLNASVESADSTPPDWVAERVTFAAAYGGEQNVAWLYTPKHRAGPHQAVVLFPGDGGFGGRPSTARTYVALVDWIIRSGRAVIAPVYKSTYERSDSLRRSIPNTSIAYRDHVVMWARDARRAIDYLESRPDIDTSRIAYFGISWGGRLGGLVPAVEPRFKTAVLFVAGFRMQSARPEADPFNFVPRIRMPVLMLNAKYDDYFPVETAQKPFFDLLGTPPQDKRYVLYEGGHVLPRTQLIAESLAWFDRYLGPVR